MEIEMSKQSDQRTPGIAPKPPAGETCPSATRRHLDELLDEALEETFPASDSQAITVDDQRRPRTGG
jgi:hypothetical protein